MLGLELSFIIGNIIMFIGTSLLIRTVLKNRTMLHGYDLLGAILTFTALLFYLNAYIETLQYTSILFSIITVAYWGFVVAFKLWYRRKKNVK